MLFYSGASTCRSSSLFESCSMARSFAAANSLAEKLEGPLLGDESKLAELLERLETSRVLLTANDTPSLRLHEILLLKATGRVLGSTMPHLGLGTSGDHGTTLLLLVLSVALRTVLAVLTSSVRHF